MLRIGVWVSLNSPVFRHVVPSMRVSMAHLWQALCYVEGNPVRAGMVRVAWRYRWSSARAHVGQAATSRLLDLGWWSRQWKEGEWKGVLSEPGDGAEASRLQLSTHRGRPLASDRFLSKLEATLDPRQEPGAVVPLAGICGEGSGQPEFLLRHFD